MDALQVVPSIAVVLSILGLMLFVKNYLPSYFTKKGENLATKEDISEITRLVEEVRTTYSSEIEKLKSQLDASNRRIQAQLDQVVYVHRVQFETEFKAFSDIWNKLVHLRSRMGSVRPQLRLDDPDEDRKRVLQANYEKFTKAKNEFVTAVDSQVPFIPKQICDALSEIIGVANKEWSELATEAPFTSDWYGKGSKNYQDLCRGIEQVSNSIRARLESLAIIPTQNTV